MNIYLIKMTLQLMRTFFLDFAYDPDTFENGIIPKEYVYSQAQADAFYKKHDRSDQVHFAVMKDQEIIGDLYLKDINQESGCCTMSIHMKNDSVKNKGYGAQAQRLALEYAFTELKLECVSADVLISNTRSRHVLEKVGFCEATESENRLYYRCTKDQWLAQYQ